MKRPTLKLKERLNNIKNKYYIKGRKHAQAEYEKLLKQIRVEKETQYQSYVNEIETIRQNYSKKEQAVKNAADAEINKIISEQSELRRKERDNHEKQIEEIRSKAMNHLKMVREKAKAEIEKAHKAETELNQLLSNARVLFNNGVAKLMYFIEKHDDLVNDAATMRHGYNEFLKTKDELADLLKGSQNVITKHKVNQISEPKNLE